ncbi:MAG: hypothetical protein HY719_16035 [Planctomycetes bacterium]|nr:hypothetical protein [Planctomycetota bacterium]
MKTIRHHATLCYYDGVQVFEARDEIGGHYVAVLAESGALEDRYLVVGVEPERLRQFRSGTLDLRSLFLKRGETTWYLATPTADIDAPVEIVPQTGKTIDSRFLPEAGFVLHRRAASSETITEARKRNNLVLELALEPPESASEHRIHAVTLAGVLTRIQRMVTHAYHGARRILGEAGRRDADPDSSLLDVIVPAAPGSFRVLLAAAKRSDMFGQTEVRRALEQIDLILEKAGDPESTLAALKEHRGHFAGAYLNLLRLLVEAKSDLRYSWAEPCTVEATARSVSGAQAIPLVDRLGRVSNLAREIVTIEGTLRKGDSTNGSWRVETEQGVVVSGKTADDGPSLSGVKIDHKYRLVCQEEIEESSLGREKRVYYLTEIEPEP